MWKFLRTTLSEKSSSPNPIELDSIESKDLDRVSFTADPNFIPPLDSSSRLRAAPPAIPLLGRDSD